MDAITNEITHWITQYGYGGLFVLLMLGIVGLPIPDETLITFSGFLVHKGDLSGAWVWITAFAGSTCGITLSYLLGNFLGVWLIHRFGYWVHMTPQRMDRVHGWFEKYGRWTLTFGYFVPGFRHLTAYAAGMTSMRWWIFAIFAYGGAVIWVSTFLALGYLLEDRWRQALRYAQAGNRVVLLVVAVGVVIAVLVWILRKQRTRPSGQA